MLPNFPKLKNKLEKLYIQRMLKVQKESGSPVLDVPRVKQFEGNKIIFRYPDGTTRELKMKKIESGIKINLENVEKMEPDDIREQIDQLAQDAARQQAKIAYDEISKAAKSVGNVIDVKGKELSIDDFFNMIEKLWIDFDKNGKPNIPQIIGGEKAVKAFSKIMVQLETEPELNKRFEQILRKKREEWRDREASRKLVG